MSSLWFWIVAAMVVTYVVLDGFDIGAGAIYLLAAKTNDERRRILRAIGPVWDGNEVWLLAAGGTLYFAFPKLYASSFSGFYLPLMMVLWLLMLRAIGIEFRAHIEHAIWQDFFDVVFCMSSILLAVFFGAALGNVVRGVPLDATGYFFEPLWTNFKLNADIGILDWYTVLIGVMALVTLTAHGSYYIALKTDEDLGRRARGFALLCWPLQFFLTFSALVATYFIRPTIMANYRNHPIGILIPIIVVACLAVMLWANPKGKERLAFIASGLYIAFMLVGAAFALYPVLLSAREHQYDLTIYNSAAGSHGLRVGLVWWTFSAILAVAYFVFVYWKFRGKVPVGEGHY
ncbi:MAG TPA: cytochrome d ubiquinol oxidase subunit II [Terriglobales bacterium]|jgi:cytochrome d ubiquinol oxidase subunit II|nr:cytochrome d ubiquinol oxidase subunit II [Terriglobales bacterium]